jgi:hypothetical protein
VADGASEGIFSKLWADLLTIHIVKDNLKLEDFKNVEHFKEWVKGIQEEWKKEILERYQVENLPWYAKNKLRQIGACSTLLALEFNMDKHEQLRWNALSIGDVCLFKIVANNLVLSFPISKSTDFSNFPPSISSKFISTINEKSIAFSEGEFRRGETLILATDAFSQWFLKMYENGEKPWSFLSAIKNDKDFRKLINRYRDLGEMRNDDVTVVLITIEN